MAQFELECQLLPVVANGRVFVASNKQLTIFGPTVNGATPAALPAVAAAVTTAPIAGTPNQVSGWIDGINGTTLTLRKRDGTHATVDAATAEAAFQSVPLSMEEAITALGTIDAQGILHAQTIVRAKDSVVLWPPDQ